MRKNVKDNDVKRTAEFLDSRYAMSQRKDARPQEVSYYNGATKAIEALGFYWRRNEDGHHEIW
jgi:hypothetical protein